MNYEDFFSLAYGNFSIFCVVSIVIMSFFLLSLRKFGPGGMLDPFHFIFSFVFSTSYAVVSILFLNNCIDGFYVLLLILYGGGFLFPIYYCLNKRKDKISLYFYDFFKSACCNKYVPKIFIIFYVLLLVPIITIKGFSLFTSTNRFQDNSGIGGLARFYDVIWLFVAGSFILYFKKILEYGGMLKKLIVFIPFSLFFILNMLIVGSKSELIQYVIFYFLVISAYGYRIKFSVVKLTILGGLSLSFALLVLFFNFKMSNTELNSDVITEAFLRLTDRIMSNGDMYYLGLPNYVIEKIENNNVLIDFFAPVMSSHFISQLAGYDVYNYDIGKQILLYHYPNFDIAGGPVEHFDLFGYKHFGLIGGMFFSMLLGCVVVIIRNFVLLSKNNKLMTIVTCSFYFKLLAIILKPSVLLGYIMDFFVVYIIIGTIAALLTGKRSFK